MPITTPDLIQEVAQALATDYDTAARCALRAYAYLVSLPRLVRETDDANAIAARLAKALQIPADEVVVRAAFYAANVIRTGHDDLMRNFLTWPPPMEPD